MWLWLVIVIVVVLVGLATIFWWQWKGNRGGRPLVHLQTPSLVEPLSRAVDRPLYLLLDLIDSRICRGGYIDAQDLLDRFAVDYFADFVYGVESDAFDRQDSLLMKVANDFLGWRIRGVRRWLPSVCPLIPNSTCRIVGFFKSLASNAIEARRSQENVRESRTDLVDWALDTLAESRGEEDDVATTMMTYFALGTGTVGTVLGSVLARMADEAVFQDTARKEVVALGRDRFEENEERLQEIVDGAKSISAIISDAVEEFTKTVHRTFIEGRHGNGILQFLRKKYHDMEEPSLWAGGDQFWCYEGVIVEKELVVSVGTLVLARLVSEYKFYGGGSDKRGRCEAKRILLRIEPILTKPHQA